ncbi:hypothetical protein F4553_003087 [Allocatelliglobosispora scoriae]|uniref:DUF4259 domain-containing protein n=1 Tax=Allocatelliglobosispora scoriae TaxID=643052 RepID=A0A841BQP6_9ACTN|nr:DUF4259 domain-containing protein [Allocatelliglobosispora scoriae]MBB5869708.1 hypothetical protein [Allocatelliglobosispora scoriae]
MGTWGYGPFDNDTAADWMADLEEAGRRERITMVREVLKATVAEEEFLDGALAAEAIAAATVVAALLPGGEELESGFDEDIFGEPDDNGPHVPEDLPGLAQAALDRALGGDSEWVKMWLDSGEIDNALAELDPIREILGS